MYVAESVYVNVGTYIDIYICYNICISQLLYVHKYMYIYILL